MVLFFVFVALATLPAVKALVQKDRVGKLPALGWNSWNAFYCDINETAIMTAANKLVDLGLKDAGYEYVNIDDCWSVKSGRDSITGQLIPDLTKFPSGIKGTADKVHALGLKVGIYSSAGTQTCADYPASLGHETLDAETWAAWGIDYLKYDNCNVPADWSDEYENCVPEVGRRPGPFPNGTCAVTNKTAPPGYDWSTSNTAERYRIMRDAILTQNRTILYSLCEWGEADVVSWGNATGNSWRMSNDIEPSWSRTVAILNENSFLLNSVGFWGHNDADMLEVGNGDLTFEENRSHFALWAAMKSPLIIGTALDFLSEELVEVLKNRFLLGFSQDERFGGPAMPYKWGVNPDWTFNATHPAEYWSGMSEEGVLVLAFNSLDTEVEKEIIWSEVPELRVEERRVGFEVVDIWTSEDLGCIEGGINRVVKGHDTMGFMVGKKCGNKAASDGNPLDFKASHSDL